MKTLFIYVLKQKKIYIHVSHTGKLSTPVCNNKQCEKIYFVGSVGLATKTGVNGYVL